MSRIGKKPVGIPKGVSVNKNDREISVQGPKGTLTFTHRAEVNVDVDSDAKSINVHIDETRLDDRQARAYWGTTRALIANMVEGVTNGYSIKMEIVGVGWGAEVQGKKLKLSIGFANAVMMDIPDGVNISVERQIVTVEGADKQAVGSFASAMRAKRKPEPYNGKGVKYLAETIRRKAGKSFGA